MLTEILTFNVLINIIAFSFSKTISLVKLFCASTLSLLRKPKYFSYRMFTDFISFSLNGSAVFVLFVCLFVFTFFALSFLSCFLRASRHFLAWSNSLLSIIPTRYLPSFKNRLTLEKNPRRLDGF